jgi:hypothetical protein
MRLRSALRRFLTGAALVVTALAPAAYAADATTPTPLATEILDIDANGVFDALTDGLLVMRYASGLRGDALINGAIGAGAKRTTVAQIESYLSQLTAKLPALCSIESSPPATSQSPVYPGTQVTLTATCLSGLAPIAYDWDLGIFNVPSLTVAPLSTKKYTVTPTNNAGTGAAFSTTVYVGGVLGPNGD